MSTVHLAAASCDIVFPDLAPGSGFVLELAGRPPDNEEAERLNRERVFDPDDALVIASAVMPANDATGPTDARTPTVRLLDHHIEYLRARGVNVDLAWAEGVRSLNDSGIKRFTGCTVTGTGLAFAYGRLSTAYTRVQLDDRANNEGKTRAPAGVTPPPYIPASVTEDVTTRLFIVEAPAKALSMVSNGFPDTIGLGGVDAGFFAKGSTKIQSDLRPFLHATRPVYIVFDAGRATNHRVARAEAKIARALLDGGAPTFVVEIPLGPEDSDQGPDDFLARHGAASMEALIKQAPSANPSVWAQAKLTESKAAARGLLKHLPFIAALEAGGPVEVAAVAKVLADITDKKTLNALCRDFQKRVKANTAQDSVGQGPLGILKVGDHVELARKYLSTLGEHVVFDEGKTYVYRTGVWKALDPSEQRATVANYSGASIQTATGVKALRLDMRDLEGIVQAAGDLRARPLFFSDAPAGLAFKNGFLRLDATRTTLVDHSPEHRVRFAYEADYDPAALCPQWEAFLLDLWTGDVDAAEKICCMQEFVGACLLGVATRFKKCVVMFGDTDSGKSTCIHMIRGLFPPGTTEAIAPGEWTNEYRRASLAGKLLNTVAELPEKEWIETESFKAFIGNDAINARQIYGVPFTYFSRAGHIFAANALPRVSDRSDATWNRMLVLTCNQRFFDSPAPGQRQAVKGLDRRILDAEQFGIIAWAVRGLERLLVQGRFTEPASSKVAVGKWKRGSDQLEEFFDDTLEVAPKSRLPRRAVYDAYRWWALSTGHKVMASERFREAFIGFLKRKTGDQEPAYKSHGIDSYRGIRQRPRDDREQLLEPPREAAPAKATVLDVVDFMEPLTDGATTRRNGEQPS